MEPSSSLGGSLSATFRVRSAPQRALTKKRRAANESEDFVPQGGANCRAVGCVLMRMEIGRSCGLKSALLFAAEWILAANASSPLRSIISRAGNRLFG